MAEKLSVGLLACWPVGLLACWPVGLLACWPVGLLACGPVGLWACGPVGLWACWPVGLLACGPVGLLACWPVGLLACGPVGLWACWPVGLWACWPVGLWACWRSASQARRLSGIARSWCNECNGIYVEGERWWISHAIWTQGPLWIRDFGWRDSAVGLNAKAALETAGGGPNLPHSRNTRARA